MHFLARIVVAVIVNGLGLFLANRFVPGFIVTTSNWQAFLTIAGALVLLNSFLKPLITLLLSPVIVITFGIGFVLVNAIILKLLDFISLDLTILTIPALLWSALLIGAVNFIFHLAQEG